MPLAWNIAVFDETVCIATNYLQLLWIWNNWKDQNCNIWVAKSIIALHREDMGHCTVMHVFARLSKNNLFCATNISVQKFCANKKSQKATNFFQKVTLKGKTVVNCAFFRSKTQILRSLWKILRNRTVAWSQLLETLVCALHCTMWIALCFNAIHFTAPHCTAFTCTALPCPVQ